MDTNFGEKKIAKRKKERKWSDLETNLLLKYLKEHEFEMPTAKDYYMCFIKTHQIKDIHWSLVRCKVRHMRSSCFKAANWLNSTTGPKSVYEGETVNVIVNRLCPHYFALKDVFSRRKSAGHSTSSVLQVQNSELETACDNSFSQQPPTAPPADGSTQRHSSQLRTASASTSTFTQSAGNVALATATPIDKSTLILLERSAVEKARISLEEKKIDFEKEKLMREILLREKEIERDERLKILELESKERVAMRELEYKYKRK